MQFYMAPMEGLTGYVYRSAYHKYYGDVDRYFTPFITNKKLNHREVNDILPEHNAGMDVVPQILTNRAEDFLCIAEGLKEYGYQTVNLNLGCPSGTVVAKNRGAGFLALPQELDHFLAEIFEKCPLRISVKTRIGKEDPAEWERLLAIYEKYPMEELIIHPRVQKDYYKNEVRMEAYALAEAQSCHSLCFNGDICTGEDYERVKSSFPGTGKVMLGRGLLKHPGLVDAFFGGVKGTEKERLRAFHDDILEGYLSAMSGDKNTLFKMKELWVYLGERFANMEKYAKKIKKSERVSEYVLWVDALFCEQELV